MGVDFYSCDECGEAYCDCGPYIRCQGCGDGYCPNCMDDQKETYADNNGELEECGNCTKDKIHEWELLPYLLDKYGLTKEDVINEIKESRK